MTFRAKTLGALVLGVGLAVSGSSAHAADASPVAPPRPAVTELALTVGDYFVFIPAQLRCKAGVPVRIVVTHRSLANGNDIPHTTVLLRHGTDIDAYAHAAIEARAEDDYIPAAFRPQVLAYTALIHAGGKLALDFTAPARRGDYTLVCSFPGHCIIGMKATLTVE